HNFTSMNGDPMLVDAANLDYHLSPGSPCVDMGADPGKGDGVDLLPLFHYVHPATFEGRQTVGVIDIGAYGLNGGTGGGTSEGGSGSGSGGGSASSGSSSGSGSGSGNGSSNGAGGAGPSGSGAGMGGGGGSGNPDTGGKGTCGCRAAGDAPEGSLAWIA